MARVLVMRIPHGPLYATSDTNASLEMFTFIYGRFWPNQLFKMSNLEDCKSGRNLRLIYDYLLIENHCF